MPENVKNQGTALPVWLSTPVVSPSSASTYGKPTFMPQVTSPTIYRAYQSPLGPDVALGVTNDKENITQKVIESYGKGALTKIGAAIFSIFTKLPFMVEVTLTALGLPDIICELNEAESRRVDFYCNSIDAWDSFGMPFKPNAHIRIKPDVIKTPEDLKKALADLKTLEGQLLRGGQYDERVAQIMLQIRHQLEALFYDLTPNAVNVQTHWESQGAALNLPVGVNSLWMQFQMAEDKDFGKRARIFSCENNGDTIGYEIDCSRKINPTMRDDVLALLARYETVAKADGSWTQALETKMTELRTILNAQTLADAGGSENARTVREVFSDLKSGEPSLDEKGAVPGLFKETKWEVHQNGNAFVLKKLGDTQQVIDFTDGLMNIDDLLTMMKDLEEAGGEKGGKFAGVIADFQKRNISGARLLYNGAIFANAPSYETLVQSGRAVNPNARSAFEMYKAAPRSISAGPAESANIAEGYAFEYDTDGNGLVDLQELSSDAVLQLFYLKHNRPSKIAFSEAYRRLAPMSQRVFDFIDRHNNRDNGREPGKVYDWSQLQITQTSHQVNFYSEYIALAREDRKIDAAMRPFFSPRIQKEMVALDKTLPPPVSVAGKAEAKIFSSLAAPPPPAPAASAFSQSLFAQPADETIPTATLAQATVVRFSGDIHLEGGNEKNPVDIDFLNGREVHLSGKLDGRRFDYVIDLQCPFPMTMSEHDEQTEALTVLKKYVLELEFNPFARGDKPAPDSIVTQQVARLQQALKIAGRPRSFETSLEMRREVVQAAGHTLWVQRNAEGRIEAVRGFKGPASDEDCAFSLYLAGRFVPPMQRNSAAEMVREMQKIAPSPVLAELGAALAAPLEFQEMQDLDRGQKYFGKTQLSGGNAVRLEYGYEIQSGEVATHLRLINWEKGRVLNQIDTTLGRDILPEEKRKQIAAILAEWKDPQDQAIISEMQQRLTAYGERAAQNANRSSFLLDPAQNLRALQGAGETAAALYTQIVEVYSTASADDSRGLKPLLELERAMGEMTPDQAATVQSAHDELLLRVVGDMNETLRNAPIGKKPTGLISELLLERPAKAGVGANSLAAQAVNLLSARSSDEQVVGLAARDHAIYAAVLSSDLQTLLDGAATARQQSRSLTEILRQRLAEQKVPSTAIDQGDERFESGRWLNVNLGHPQGQGPIADEEVWNYLARTRTVGTQALLRQEGIDSPFVDDEQLLTQEVLRYGGKPDATSDAEWAGFILRAVVGDSGDERRIFRAYQTLFILNRQGKIGALPQFFIQSDAASGQRLGLGIWVQGEERFYALTAGDAGRSARMLNVREAMSRFYSGQGQDILRGRLSGNGDPFIDARKRFRLAFDVDHRNIEAVKGLVRSYLQEGGTEGRKQGLVELQNLATLYHNPAFGLDAAWAAQVRVLRAALYAADRDGVACKQELEKAVALDPQNQALQVLVEQAGKDPNPAQGIFFTLPALVTGSDTVAGNVVAPGAHDEFLDLVHRSYSNVFPALNATRQGLTQYHLAQHAWEDGRMHLGMFIKNFRAGCDGSQNAVQFAQAMALTPSAYRLNAEEKLAVYDYFKRIGWAPEFCLRKYNPKSGMSDIARTSAESDTVLSIALHPPGIDPASPVYIEDFFETNYDQVASKRLSLEKIALKSAAQSAEIPDDVINALSIALTENGDERQWLEALQLDLHDGLLQNVKLLHRMAQTWIDRATTPADLTQSLQKLSGQLFTPAEIQALYDTDLGRYRVKARAALFAKAHVVVDETDELQGLRRDVESLQTVQEIQEYVRDMALPKADVRAIENANPEIYRNNLLRYLVDQRSLPLMRDDSSKMTEFKRQGDLAFDAKLYDKAFLAYRKSYQTLQESGQHGPVGVEIALRIAQSAEKLGLQPGYRIQSGGDVLDPNSEALRYYELALRDVMQTATNGFGDAQVAYSVFIGLGNMLGSLLSYDRPLTGDMATTINTISNTMLNIPGDHFLKQLSAYQVRANVQSMTIPFLALLFYQAAGQVNPTDVQSQIGMALVEPKVGLKAEACGHITRLLAQEGLLDAGQRANLLIQLADTEIEIGSRHSAREHYNQVLRTAPPEYRELALERLFALHQKWGDSDPRFYDQMFSDIADVDESLFTPSMRESVHLHRALFAVLKGAPITPEINGQFITAMRYQVGQLRALAKGNADRQKALADLEKTVVGLLTAQSGMTVDLGEIVEKAFDRRPSGLVAAHQDALVMMLRELAKAHLKPGGDADFSRVLSETLLYLQDPQSAKHFFDGQARGELEFLQLNDLSPAFNKNYQMFYDTALILIDAHVALSERIPSQELRNNNVRRAYELAKTLFEVPGQLNIEALKRYTDLAPKMAAIDVRATFKEMRFNDALGNLQQKAGYLNDLAMRRATVPPEMASELFARTAKLREARGKADDVQRAQVDYSLSTFFDPSSYQKAVDKAVGSYVDLTLYNYLYNQHYYGDVSGGAEQRFNKDSMELKRLSDRDLTNLKRLQGGEMKGESSTKEAADPCPGLKTQVINGRHSLVLAMSMLQDSKSAGSQSIVTVNGFSPLAVEIHQIAKKVKNGSMKGLTKLQDENPNVDDRVAILAFWSFDRLLEAKARGDQDQVAAFSEEIDNLKSLLVALKDDIRPVVLTLLQESFDRMTPDQLHESLVRMSDRLEKELNGNARR